MNEVSSGRKTSLELALKTELSIKETRKGVVTFLDFTLGHWDDFVGMVSEWGKNGDVVAVLTEQGKDPICYRLTLRDLLDEGIPEKTAILFVSQPQVAKRVKDAGVRVIDRL
ncbi:MAG: hypothetical protein IT292_09325 [Deltaproteobacteria bacterium]|nr:hypothetical protein [Deltaproteobacteria bacterium]